MLFSQTFFPADFFDVFKMNWSACAKIAVWSNFRALIIRLLIEIFVTAPRIGSCNELWRSRTFTVFNKVEYGHEMPYFANFICISLVTSLRMDPSFPWEEVATGVRNFLSSSHCVLNVSFQTQELYTQSVKVWYSKWNLTEWISNLMHLHSYTSSHLPISIFKIAFFDRLWVAEYAESSIFC